jgi:hypothetical protein
VRSMCGGTMQLLRQGLSTGCDSAAGWAALAATLHELETHAAGATAAAAGLAALRRRRAAGAEPLPQAEALLRLSGGRCLLGLGQLDAAAAEFRALAGEA